MSAQTIYVFNAVEEKVYPFMLTADKNNLEDLRTLIFEHLKVPPSMQRLRSKGFVLPLSGWLWEFDVGDKDTVVLAWDSQAFPVVLQHAC